MGLRLSLFGIDLQQSEIQLKQIFDTADPWKYNSAWYDDICDNFGGVRWTDHHMAEAQSQCRHHNPRKCRTFSGDVEHFCLCIRLLQIE